MKESWGDRDQVINTANGTQWKLCKPKGTNCRILQCATPAEHTGTEVSTLTVYFYSILLYSILHSQALMMNVYLTLMFSVADSVLFLFTGSDRFCLFRSTGQQNMGERKKEDDVMIVGHAKSLCQQQLLRCSIFSKSVF